MVFQSLLVLSRYVSSVLTTDSISSICLLPITREQKLDNFSLFCHALKLLSFFVRDEISFFNTLDKLMITKCNCSYFFNIPDRHVQCRKKNDCWVCFLVVLPYPFLQQHVCVTVAPEKMFYIRAWARNCYF